MFKVSLVLNFVLLLVAAVGYEVPTAWAARPQHHVRAKILYEFVAEDQPGEPGEPGEPAGKWRHRLVRFDRLARVGPGELQSKAYPQFLQEHSVPRSQIQMPQLPQWQHKQILEFSGPQAKVQQKLSSLGLGEQALALRRKSMTLKSRSMALRNVNAQDEVRTLVDSGPAANRIDLVFMGDGYTASEREKFFADAERLVGDLFGAQTFSSYLPLFNVHAVFRASLTSGIGKGKATETAYGLYREGDTLRAIFPANEEALRDSCAQALECDYPVVVANDDSYGGLGGEFAITTRSTTSGTIVLRHELGHNFGKVGEEYDGGGYFGANHSSSLKQLGWKKWLSDPQGNIKGEDQVALALGWPWQKIGEKSFQQSFKSSGARDHAVIRMSLSGLAGPGAFGVFLDGESLEIPTLPTNDRSFVDLTLEQPLAAGVHNFEVRANRNTGLEYLSSFTLHEYANDPALDPEKIGAFPVFGPGDKPAVQGYRPTNEACLMRNMVHPWFCLVCQENNWHELLGQLRLHDSVQVNKRADGDVQVVLLPMGLGQFRTAGSSRLGEELLQIRWFLGQTELIDFREQASASIEGKVLTQWKAKSGAQKSKLRIELKFLTPEIRNEKDNFNSDVVEVSL